MFDAIVSRFGIELIFSGHCSHETNLAPQIDNRLPVQASLSDSWRRLENSTRAPWSEIDVLIFSFSHEDAGLGEDYGRLYQSQVKSHPVRVVCDSERHR